MDTPKLAHWVHTDTDWVQGNTVMVRHLGKLG